MTKEEIMLAKEDLYLKLSQHMDNAITAGLSITQAVAVLLEVAQDKLHDGEVKDAEALQAETGADADAAEADKETSQADTQAAEEELHADVSGAIGAALDAGLEPESVRETVDNIQAEYEAKDKAPDA